MREALRFDERAEKGMNYKSPTKVFSNRAKKKLF